MQLQALLGSVGAVKRRSNPSDQGIPWWDNKAVAYLGGTGFFFSRKLTDGPP